MVHSVQNVFICLDAHHGSLMFMNVERVDRGGNEFMNGKLIRVFSCVIKLTSPNVGRVDRVKYVIVCLESPLACCHDT